MKAMALVKFKDLKENKIRNKGEEFILSKERFKEINSTKFGNLVKEIKEEE